MRHIKMAATTAVLAHYGLTKTAGPMLSLGLMGGGLGAGIGGVQAYRTADPGMSPEDRLLEGLKGAGRGGLIGTGAGTLAGGAFRVLAPDAYKSVSKGPFPGALDALVEDPSGKNTAKALLQGAYRAYTNPIVRGGLGAYAGYEATHAYHDWRDEQRLKQLAGLQAASEGAPEIADVNKELAALMAERRLGKFRGTPDGAGFTP